MTSKPRALAMDFGLDCVCQICTSREGCHLDDFTSRRVFHEYEYYKHGYYKRVLQTTTEVSAKSRGCTPKTPIPGSQNLID